MTDSLTLQDVRSLSSPKYGPARRGRSIAIAERRQRRVSHAVMADALKEAASEKLEGFSQDVKVRLVP